MPMNASRYIKTKPTFSSKPIEVGDYVGVWWGGDKCFYKGVVVEIHDGFARVAYDDGEWRDESIEKIKYEFYAKVYKNFEQGKLFYDKERNKKYRIVATGVQLLDAAAPAAKELIKTSQVSAGLSHVANGVPSSSTTVRTDDVDVVKAAKDILMFSKPSSSSILLSQATKESSIMPTLKSSSSSSSSSSSGSISQQPLATVANGYGLKRASTEYPTASSSSASSSSITQQPLATVANSHDPKRARTGEPTASSASAAAEASISVSSAVLAPSIKDEISLIEKRQADIKMQLELLKQENDKLESQRKEKAHVLQASALALGLEKAYSDTAQSIEKYILASSALKDSITRLVDVKRELKEFTQEESIGSLLEKRQVLFSSGFASARNQHLAAHKTLVSSHGDVTQLLKDSHRGSPSGQTHSAKSKLS